MRANSLTAIGLYICGAVAVAGWWSASQPTPTLTITSPRIIDGDTFAVGRTHYRLTRIDAPELPGHCRPGRHCVAGDAYAAKTALKFLAAADGPWRCTVAGTDYYKRTLVSCVTSSNQDIGQLLLDAGLVSLYHRS